jgi:hypothetical protein
MSTLYIRDKWGKKRKAKEIECAFCHKKIVVRTFSNRPNIFCSSECAHKSRIKQIEVHCSECKKLFKIKKCRIKEHNFCSRECKELNQSGNNHPRWTNGFASYRDRALKEHGYFCSNGDVCLLKDILLPEFAFEVDHIDGDRTNNNINNLQVLCILCHRKKTLGL